MSGGAFIRVAAAIIERNREVLIGKRRAGHFSGRWEFPGGKIEEGETPEECLRRELHEELAIEARIGALFQSTVYAYSHATVELITFRCEILSGEIALRDHTEVRWVPLTDLERYDFPEADRGVVEKLTSSLSMP